MKLILFIFIQLLLHHHNCYSIKKISYLQSSSLSTIKYQNQQYRYYQSIITSLDSVSNIETSLTLSSTSTSTSTSFKPIDINIDDRTYQCLDIKVILDSLKKMTTTISGSQLADTLLYDNIDEINKNYAKVDQLSYFLGSLPLRTNMNVWIVLNAIENNQSPPEKEELCQFSEYIDELIVLHEFMKQNINKIPLFQELVDQMVLPNEFINIFMNSFDSEGNLNSIKYPIIGKLTREANALKGKIIQTLKTILNSQDMKEKISDNGYQEIDGRYCIMLKNTYKKGIGIVHSSSNTGRTIYVEPMEIVEPTNEMKSKLAELRAEETKILFDMCRSIATYKDEIKKSMKAVTEVDILRAKARLGLAMKGVIPEVQNEGLIRCLNSKHPILLLRGIEPIGNTIELSNDNTALVISGPNAGGKTIILKTAGLFALMVRYAIPIPAKQGARVDLFQVMADIGDMQTVSGDLSTFSGHLIVCREMLEKAKSYQGQSLVLLDEIGTGTDPAQGAALAQAVLEELIKLGSRVIVTTHYRRIKELAAEDERFRIAAMEFIENRPTYRLRVGYVGESYALEAGKRMNLPDNVLSRATALLDDESRRIIALQKKLEEETEIARQKQIQLDNEILSLETRESTLQEAKLKLDEQISKIREGKVDEFLIDLRNKERELELMLRNLEDYINKEGPNRDEKTKALNEIKTSVREFRTETEREVVLTASEDIATPLIPGEPIEEGTTLVILERGNLFGTRGITSQRNKGRGRIVVRVAGVDVKMERHLLGFPIRSGKLGFPINNENSSNTTMSAKEKRLLKMLEEDLVDLDKKSIINRSNSIKKMSANTLTIKDSSTVAEAHDATVNFIEQIIDKSDDFDVLYIHHANKRLFDTDNKTKFRTLLKKHPFVKNVKSATNDEGGDAYTVIQLDY